MFHPDHQEGLEACENVPMKPGDDHPARLLSYNSLYAVKQCQNCHTKWNRDVNAARNIRRIGISMLKHERKHHLFNRYRPPDPLGL
jgi:hypothetical protein